MNSFGGNLYTTIKKTLTSLASIDMAGCSDIFYMLDGPNFNAAATAPGFTPAEFTLASSSVISLSTNPTSIRNVGVYFFKLLSCI